MFQVVERVGQYDGRDAVTGWRNYVAESHHTLAWALHRSKVLDREVGCETIDVYVRRVDARGVPVPVVYPPRFVAPDCNPLGVPF
jgi:hypothetical protein